MNEQPEIEALLKQVPLFTTLPQDEIRRLAQILRPVDFPADQTLFQEGVRDDRFYILVEGEAEVFKKMGARDIRKLSIIQAGSLIGEMSVFSQDRHHTATVRSLTPLRLLEMSRKEFDALLLRQPLLSHGLVGLLSRRLEQTENATILDLREKNRRLTRAYDELRAAQAQIVEKEKLEHELAIARQMQGAILPAQLPQIEAYNFGALMVPARAVGGDFYDFFPLEGGRLGIVVGDVSDKGMPAALFMALSFSLIRAEAQRWDSPAETLLSVNRHLLDISSSTMFVTAVYAILEPASGSLRFTRAGHPYPEVVDDRGNPSKIGTIRGMPLGLFEDVTLEESSAIIEAGGLALLYSDGLTEAEGDRRNQFGLNRIRRILALQNKQPAQAICDQLLAEVRAFGVPEQQHDDITIVALRREG